LLTNPTKKSWSNANTFFSSRLLHIKQAVDGIHGIVVAKNENTESMQDCFDYILPSVKWLGLYHVDLR
jgi:hypothetical protein